MSSVIYTNTASLVAQKNLLGAQNALATSVERLSSGLRINRARDDAAGLSVANSLQTQINGANQGIRNMNDAISMVQTAEGATQEITNMLQRMRELAIQASNDTYSADDRAALDTEIVELEAEITRIAKNTKWNNMSILDNPSEKVLQVGIASNDDSTIKVAFVDLTGAGLNIVGLDVKTHAAAQTSLDKIDTAIGDVDEFRADMGAKINRLNFATDNLANISINTSASRSRIEDADFAKASSELARTQIIQQAATAVLSQANTSQQSVLKLLQG
jgi:flagellin